MRIASLLFAVFLLVGCDSSDDRVLDADFYVGTWTLVSLSDGSGDQTARQAIDDLTIEFDADGSFDLDAKFNDSAAQDDISIQGTYQAQAAIPSVILTVSPLAATLRANASSDDNVSLTAPAVIVNALLAGLPFQFEGDTTVRIRRL